MRGRSTKRADRDGAERGNGTAAVAGPEAPDATTTTGPLPDPAIAAGVALGGFTVTDVLGELDGIWTVADGTDVEGRPGRLWISTAAAAQLAAVRRHVALLARLRAAPRSADLPLAPFTFAGPDGDRLVLARRTLPWPTLADRLDEGSLERAEAVRLLSQVAGAVDTLKAFGVPHDHLTPSTIVLSRQRPAGAIVQDYGFEPPHVPSCMDPALVDVADYLAPELAEGAALDTPGDVYALACMLVECLTGWPPFPEDRPLLVLEAHRTRPAPLIAEATGLPAELDRVLQIALSKRPEQRQQSATALLRGVQRAFGRQRAPIPVLRPEAPRRAAARATSTVSPPRPDTGAERDGAAAAAVTAAPSAPAAPRARREKAKPAGAAGARARAETPRRRRSKRPLFSGPARRRPVTSGALGAAAVLVLATAGGFATATIRPGTSTSATAPPGPAAAALADPGAGQRAAVVAAVDRTMDKLDAQRADARQALSAARDPHAQAIAATSLARTYRAARRALPPPAALAAAAPAPRLHLELTQIDRAYRAMALAAWSRDPAMFARATRRVAAGERQLDAALRQLAQQA
jgi:serine/threonine-protein kinase